jgi:hypothetical protein
MRHRIEKLKCVECKFTKDELDGKSVEFRFPVNNMRGNGEFSVEECDKGLLSIAIEVVDQHKQEIFGIYLYQMMAYLIERNLPGSRFDFRCFQK